MKESLAKQFIQKVEEDYNTIALHFSQTRSAPWPEFKYFEPLIKPNTTILDLGCGNGRLLTFLEPHLKKNNIKYIGIDISQGLLDHAKKLHPNHTFIRGSQVSIPLEDESIDQVWSIAAFHHLPSRNTRIQALQEMHRILKPKGHLIMTNWNLFQKKYRPQLKQAIFRSIKTFGSYSPTDLFIPWSHSKVDRYYHSFLPHELKSLLKNTSLKTVDQFYTKKESKVPFLKSFNICTIAQKF